MDNNLPLLMLVLACSLFILLVIYVMHYKKQQRRRRPMQARHQQEPEVGTEAYGSEGSENELHQLAGELDLLADDAIISEVKIHKIAEPLPTSLPKAKKKITRTQAPSLIVLHVLAQQGKTFIGYELLQSLLSAGLRFGEKNIFHRHEQLSGKGEILFSVASATEPGTFNLDEVGGLTCIGLSLFMNSSKVAEPEKVLNILVDTARLLAEDLGGRVCDEQYQELTVQKIAEYQQLFVMEDV